jgi:hypothetical protein
MTLPAIPDTVQHLDADVVIDVLSRHGVNVSAAARELCVPSADLRKLLWARPQFVAAADEMAEHRLDLSEAIIYETLKSDDPRMRFAAACFTTRYSAKAGRRGWLTNSTSDIGADKSAEPRHITLSWRSPQTGESIPPARPLPTERVVRDGIEIELPVYGAHEDEGEGVAPPAGDDARHVESAPFKQMSLDRRDEISLADADLLSEEQLPAAVPAAAASTPSPPELPIWPGPGGPPPLVANKFRAWIPPQPKAQPRRERELALEPEEPPQRASVYRPSRGGCR